jgi:hypothetical protein
MASLTNRFGYGIRSEVFVDLGDGTPIIHKGAFKLASETPSDAEALIGMEGFFDDLASQASLGNDFAAGGIGTGDPSPYWVCWRTCIAEAHNDAWDDFLTCCGIATTAAGVIAGGCALACVFAGGAWPVCVTACAAPLELLVPTPLLGACLAAYIARVTASIPVCTLGCLWL